MPSSASNARPDDSQGEEAPDENIPLQGTHQGATEDPLTSSVRAQQPPDPAPRAADEEAGNNAKVEASEDASAEQSGDLGTYQLAHDPASGRHRVRVRPPSEEAEAPGGGFRELSRHSSPQDMSDALDSQLPDGPRFIVLENTDTGAVRFEREGALSDDWFANGRFDQVTVFESEDDAAAYADERGSEMNE